MTSLAETLQENPGTTPRMGEIINIQWTIQREPTRRTPLPYFTESNVVYVYLYALVKAKLAYVFTVSDLLSVCKLNTRLNHTMR